MVTLRSEDTHTLSYAACFVQALAATITPHFGVAG